MRRTLLVGVAAPAMLIVGAGALAQPLALRDPALQVSDTRAPTPAPDFVVQASDYEDNYANDAGDAFFFAPGARINAGDVSEPRITIRGFALANRQERGTVAMFRDGAPLTDVHGATETAEIDLLSVARIDIYRGDGDFMFAGDNLGGAVNFISPTGRDLGPLWDARADGGASIEGDPNGRLHTRIAGVSRGGAMDYYAGVTGLYEEGLRDNNRRNSVIFNSNLGYEIAPTVKTRFFVEAIRSDIELAGGLTPEEFAADPTEPLSPITLGPLFPGGPIIRFTDGARQDDFARFLRTARVANQTDFRLLGHDVTVGAHFARHDTAGSEIDFIGVTEENGTEWGARLAFGSIARLFGFDVDYRAGASYASGAQDMDRFENIAGDKGDQTVDTRQKSANFQTFLEAAFRPLSRLAVTMGAKFLIVDRELTDGDDETPEERRFTGVSARLGATYELRDDLNVFASIYRSYEPPTFSELISDDPTDFNGLDEQDAFTYEAGFRGAVNERLRWDITYFNTDVENEIVNIDDPETNGVGDTLVNVATTVHKGVELGLDIDLMGRRASGAPALTLRSAYAYNSFRFKDGGPIDDVDGNRLAGAPQHSIRGEVRYENGGAWFAAVNVDVAAGAFFADHANLVSAPSPVIVGFSAGYKLNEQIELFASGENLFDADYIVGLTPVASQGDQNARLYAPGRRASVYGGLRYRF
ncbi:MAG: TonB-dependent receptor [Pseudomonadota bacterium]